jgi:amino acid transporter
MFERFRRTDATQTDTTADGRTAVADRPATRDGAARRDEDFGWEDRPARTTGATTATRTGITHERLRDVRARQRDEYGGINWGAAFFGWLVAVGLGVILIGLIAGAGAAIGLTQLSGSDTDTIGLGGGIALLAVLMIAYYAGGYVAGRMSRFDGARQGAGAWLMGVLITVILGVVAAVLGDQYNVLSRLDLPRIPIGAETLTTGGIIATVAVLLGTLFAAIAGGKVGERYHRRIDRLAIDA